jgi:large subunit ribosomal protein L18
MIYGGNVKMAKNIGYRVQLRRRREGKTDYQARKALVASRKPRLVTRASLKNIEVQIIVAKPHGDVVLASANSRELIKSFGWKPPTGNIPAAYLTGLVCGLKAKGVGIKEAILDVGLVSPTKGSKIFAVLSGVLDAGVVVPHSEEKIVKERMKGEHITMYAKNLGLGSEEYMAKFSQYTTKGVVPEKIVEHVNKVKADIVASFKETKVTEEAAEPKMAPKEKMPMKKVAKEKAIKIKEAQSRKTIKSLQKVAPKENATKEKVPKAKAKTQPKAPKLKAPADKVTDKGGKKA